MSPRPVVDAVSYLARAAGDWLVLWTFHHRGLAAAVEALGALGARGGCGTDEDGVWRSWDTFCGRGAISFQEGSDAEAVRVRVVLRAWRPGTRPRP